MLLLAAVPDFPPVPLHLAGRLEAGEIVVEMRNVPGPPSGTSTGLIGAPIDKVWTIMTDFGSYSRYYTGIPRSQMRRRLGRSVQAHFIIEFPWPMPNRWLIQEFDLYPEQHTVTWKRLDGTVKRFDGAFKFTAWGRDRTLMQYVAVIDPGFSLMPSWLLSYFTAQSLPGVVSGPRDYMQRMARAGG